MDIRDDLAGRADGEKHGEKQQVVHVASPRDDVGSEMGAVESLDDVSPEEQRRIVRRIDCRLLLTTGTMYCCSLMDRNNMSAAIIAGMRDELHLGGYKYNIANLVFFFPYVVFQLPSTVFIRAIGPRNYLSAIALCWGAVTIGMGFVNSFAQLAGLRIILGTLEAGFFPGCVYLLSTWYTRYEVGKRYSVFYILGSVAASFAGILAYGLMQLGGREGISSWRWIFIVEGALTCALGVMGYGLLVNFPDSKRSYWGFLSPRECCWVVNRIQKDRGDAKLPSWSLPKFVAGAVDWKIWAYAMIFFNTTTVTYSLNYNLPILLTETMGFSIGAAQCLVAPPHALSGIVMFFEGHLGDKYHVRGPMILFNMLLCLIGLPLMGWHSSAAVRYFGVFLVTAGSSSNIPATMSFQANNIRGQWKRALCSGTLVGFGALGGIAGSVIFREQDKATGYKPGMWTCIACSLFSVILVLLCDCGFYRENKLANEGRKRLERHEADASDDFRYTY